MNTASAVSPAPTSNSGHVPGNKGIWVGIFCVLVEFLLLFGVYFIAKAHHPAAFRNLRIRAVLHGFVTLVPLLVIFSHGWGGVIKRLTTLG